MSLILDISINVRQPDSDRVLPPGDDGAASSGSRGVTMTRSKFGLLAILGHATMLRNAHPGGASMPLFTRSAMRRS